MAVVREPGDAAMLEALPAQGAGEASDWPTPPRLRVLVYHTRGDASDVRSAAIAALERRRATDGNSSPVQRDWAPMAYSSMTYAA